MAKLIDIIQDAARARGITSAPELHRALGEAGTKVTYQAVYYWWTGQFRPSRHAPALADVLGLPAEQHLELFQAEVNPPTPSPRPARTRKRARAA